MPRGDNPKSRANLSKGRPFNAETAREAKAKSVKSQSVVKPFAEYIKQQLETEISNGKVTKEGLALVLLNQVKNGNLKAWELMLKLIGESPTEQISVALDTIDSEETTAMLQELKNAQARREDDNK